MTHSPGPWRQDIKHVFDRDGVTVCEPWRIDDVPLIAAAPEMLIALKELVDQCQARHDSEGLSPHEAGEFMRARAAIAKAEAAG